MASYQTQAVARNNVCRDKMRFATLFVLLNAPQIQDEMQSYNPNVNIDTSVVNLGDFTVSKKGVFIRISEARYKINIPFTIVSIKFL